MIEKEIKGFRKLSNKFIHSIGFVPAVMGIGFLLLAIACLELDNKGMGQNLNNKVRWLTLKDSETARSIISVVAAGIISLTVFSFSMVMVVMNQAAQQMSNRILDNLIGDKVQKLVLGCYVGTIVYSLFLLTTVSKSENSIPVLSIYVLLAFAIMDIFLFIYFLHYITQSVRYEQLIQRIHNKTLASLKSFCQSGVTEISEKNYSFTEEIHSVKSGYFQGFALNRLMKLAQKHDFLIKFLYPEGSYILKGIPFFSLSFNEKLKTDTIEKIRLDIDFYYGQEIPSNPYYGFLHLMEVGIKALSPGINDPGTAVLSLNALADMLVYRMEYVVPNCFNDDQGITRVVTKELSVEEIFETSVLPIWDYGKHDRTIKRAFLRILEQLRHADKKGDYIPLFTEMEKKVKE